MAATPDDSQQPAVGAAKRAGSGVAEPLASTVGRVGAPTLSELTAAATVARDKLPRADSYTRPPYRPVDAPAKAPEPDSAATPRRRLARRDLRYLSPREADIVAKLAEAIIVPPREAGVCAPSAIDIALNADRFLAAMDTRMRWQIRFALFVFNLWPVTRLGLPFRWSSARARQRFVAVFPTNRGPIMRKLSKLKNLVLFNFYGDARSNPQTGYEPFESWHPAATQVREAIAARDAEHAEHAEATQAG